MSWTILLSEAFEKEFLAFEEEVQDQILRCVRLLEDFGPQLGRPYVDTLKGSKHSNMKELRFNAADGVWRVAFVFDPTRQAILLVAGDKSGSSSDKFYRWLIDQADKRYGEYLRTLTKEKAR
jgi:hypothetical protein